MLNRYVYIAPSPVNIPQGANSLAITGLALTYFNPAPSKVLGQVKGDQSAAIYPIDITAPTTDGFTVTFNTTIPNGNFYFDFCVI
jgi:hypothetical protein